MDDNAVFQHLLFVGKSDPLAHYRDTMRKTATHPSPAGDDPCSEQATAYPLRINGKATGRWAIGGQLRQTYRCRKTHAEQGGASAPGATASGRSYSLRTAKLQLDTL